MGLLVQVQSTGQRREREEREREIKREWVRVSEQHSLLVFTSRAACLSRFALIKDKGSLIGCRCAALMSVTTATPPPPPAKTHHRCTSAHLSFDALQHLPNLSSPLLLLACHSSPGSLFLFLSPYTHTHTHLSHSAHYTPRTIWGTKSLSASVHFLLNEIVFRYWYSFPGSLHMIELSKKTSKPHPLRAFHAKTNARRKTEKNTVIQMQAGLFAAC